MARANGKEAPKVVNQDLVARALAKSVADGDIVNFRLIFAPFSPARVDSSERFEDGKYGYLLPAQGETSAAFEAALKAVKSGETWAHAQRELAANRPSQLPAELVLLLGDNAVRTGKWTSAAQAYELLRIRRRMQDEFFTQGAAALEAGDMPRAVRAFRVGLGLGFDYAAFPEPLPLVPQFQTRALMLHGQYPQRPEDCVALLDADMHVQVALDYLLYDTAASSRLRDVSPQMRLEFLREYILQSDPEWKTFAANFSEACTRTMAMSTRSQQVGGQPGSALAQEIAEQQSDDPWEITRALLGRSIEGGEWWQYLKELAYEHPASVLFISRQIVGEDEVLMPRLRGGSLVPSALGLSAPAEAKPAGA